MDLTQVTLQTKALLFDFDGVLVSSTASAERCWRRWAVHYGLPNGEHFLLPHGVPARDIIREANPNVDPDEALALIEELEMNDTAGIEVLPGVRSLLASLPPERWSIVTSCTARLLPVRMAAAGLPMPANVVTADQVQRGKPDPEPFRRGAELLGFAPADCVVVEDAVSGVAAGLAAGCRVLALLTSTSAEKLQAADWLAPSLHGALATSRGDVLEVRIAVQSGSRRVLT